MFFMREKFGQNGASRVKHGIISAIASAIPITVIQQQASGTARLNSLIHQAHGIGAGRHRRTPSLAIFSSS